ncbi:outer membrane protein assembly factor BamC [Ramlibacter tataouinensis]|uniref:outer membrane protein assembly factor BamC n=1 Tax=Ramlibacter tataouinensis TaxID=94132 RepID=UPI0022F3BB95|nr:outer membrane protein assembly factor BamC [Ramlibacter tataouinensis]WBY02717.1 outer membrane protein assembly factor BamC [Ramlibacter tataouinensis]
MKRFAKLGVLAACAALAACSILENDRIDYKSASKGATLEVPPDLTQLARDSRYQVPGGPVTASSYQVGQAAPGVPTAANTVGDVRIERAGDKRWLVVNRPADQLWGPVRDFWQENGFLLAMDQANLGIMETDWAENRAKIPQDFIRSTLGKLLDSVYSTAERDRFRTRFERTPGGGTEIFISHRGMVEVYSNTQKDQTVWQPRPADPELETEFLRRLMVKLGVPQEQSKALVAAGAVKPIARVASVDSKPVVQIDEGFDRAWRRVGLALDRTGFTVEDRDRSQGTYFVRYVPPNPDKKEPGFLGKLLNFGRGDKTEAPLKYRIAVRSQGESTTVSVLDAQGAPEASANAQRIVQVIADDLK